MDDHRISVFSLMLLLFTASAIASQDPTAPLNWVEPKPSSDKKVVKTYPVPHLQSIVCREELSCYAVLNSKLVEANESVGGYKVIKISESEVVVKRGDKTHSLALFQSDIKK